MNITKLVLFCCFFLGYTGLFAQPAQSFLKQYWEVLESQHPALLASEEQFKSTLRRIPQAKAWPNPQISIGYFLRSVETRVGPQQARFSLQQAIPWWKDLQQRERAASLKAEAAMEQYKLTRAQLIKELKINYYPLYLTSQSLRIQETYTERLREEYQRLTSGLAQGQYSRVDLLRLEMQLAEAENEVLVLEEAFEKKTSKFNRLLQHPDTSRIQLPDSLGIPVEGAQVSLDSLSQHPSVLIWSRQGKAQQAQSEALKWKRWPQISLGLDYLLIDERQDIALTDNGKNALMPMVSLSLPLFQKDEKAHVMETKHLSRAAHLSAEEVKSNLQEEWADLNYELKAARKRFEQHQSQFDLSRQAFHLLAREVANGQADYEELLRMERRSLEYQQEALKDVTDYWLNRAKLDYLMMKDGL